MGESNSTNRAAQLTFEHELVGTGKGRGRGRGREQGQGHGGVGVGARWGTGRG